MKYLAASFIVLLCLTAAATAALAGPEQKNPAKSETTRTYTFPAKSATAAAPARPADKNKPAPANKLSASSSSSVNQKILDENSIKPKTDNSGIKVSGYLDASIVARSR